MVKRKGKLRNNEDTNDTEQDINSDSQIDYTFDGDLECRRPRISHSPRITRSRARNIAASFATPVQSVESAVVMDSDNGANALPSGSGQQDPPGTVGLNILEGLTARLEQVLTMNHVAFINEISSLRQTVVASLNINPNIQNPTSFNHDNLNQNRIPQNSGNMNQNQINDTSLHNQTINSDSSRNTNSSNSIKIDKWKISYDGTTDVDDFLFKVDSLKNQWNCPADQVVASFHTFLKGKAETWFWSYLKQHPNTTYDILKLAITKQFGKIENDCDKIVKMIERRQTPKESFDDFFTDMLAMNVRLSQPMSDTKMIDLIKNNTKESLGSLLFTTDVFSLDHLRDSARKAEKYVTRQQQVRTQKKLVSEIEIPEMVEELVEEEGEIAAFRYQGQQNRERKEIDTRHFKCWNCDQVGHSFYDCPSETRNLFCFRCGEKNITTVQCKKHQKNKSSNE